MSLIYSKGQLGTGQLDDHLDPIQVEALAGIKIVKIAAGKPLKTYLFHLLFLIYFKVDGTQLL